MIKIVGYEGSRRPEYVCTYASAAVLTDDDTLYNGAPIPILSSKDGATRLSKYIGKGTITPLEASIELPENTHHMFVFDMPADIFDRAPYLINNDNEYIIKLVYGYLGSSKGETRAYHAFESMEKLQKWLVNMHVGKPFVMTKYEP